MSDEDNSKIKNNGEDNETLSLNEIQSRLNKINSLYQKKPLIKEESNQLLFSPSTIINPISSITKTDSSFMNKIPTFKGGKEEEFCKMNNESDDDYIEQNSFQLLNHKRKFKKISKKKNEISVQIIDCPSNYNVVNNYAYLKEEFHDKEDSFSLFNTQQKEDLIEQMLHKKVKNKTKGKNSKDKDKEKDNELSFGDTPCKIYHDYLIKGMQKEASKINQTMTSLAIFPSASGLQCSFPLYYYDNTQFYSEKESKKTNKSRFLNNLNASPDGSMDILNDEEELQDINQSHNEVHIRINKEKDYKCGFCSLLFSSPQGLGGHMSRTHSEQSKKFQKKKEIRTIREPQRKMLQQAKIILCNRHNKDFQFLHKNKQGKEIIKRLIITYKKEYKNIRRDLSFIDKNINDNQ